MVDWIDRHFALGFKLHNYLPMNDAKYLFYQFNWFRNFSFIHTHTHTHTQHIHVTDDTHIVFISVQFSCQSCTMFETPWTAACQVSLSITNSRTLLKLVSIELVMPSNHLILCHPLLLLPSIYPSIRVFSNKSVLRIMWPRVLQFHLQHLSFQWIFRTDFLWDWLVGSPCSPRDSRVFSNTTVQKHQFFGIHLSL